MVSFRHFLAGVVTAALAYVLSPEIKKRVKPMIDKGVEKGKETMEQIEHKMKKCVMEEESEGRETVEEELERLREERKTYLEEIKELKNLVNRLLNEISQLKDKN